MDGDVLPLEALLSDPADRLYENHDLRDTAEPARMTCAFGNGTATLILFALGRNYADADSPQLTAFVGAVLRDLAWPLIDVSRRDIDIVVQRVGNARRVHLINMREGRHALKTVVYDEVPAIDDVTVTIYGGPVQVSSPLGKSFCTEKGEGFTRIRLERLEIHTFFNCTDVE